MVAAFIQPDLNQLPLIFSNVISLDCALRFNELVLRRSVGIPSSPYDVYLSIVLDAVGVVSPLQMHLSPRSESLSLQVKLPILSRVRAADQEASEPLVRYYSLISAFSHDRRGYADLDKGPRTLS